MTRFNSNLAHVCICGCTQFEDFQEDIPILGGISLRRFTIRRCRRCKRIIVMDGPGQIKVLPPELRVWQPQQFAHRRTPALAELDNKVLRKLAYALISLAVRPIFGIHLSDNEIKQLRRIADVVLKHGLYDKITPEDHRLVRDVFQYEEACKVDYDLVFKLVAEVYE